MFGSLGMAEVVVIIIVALIIFGPRRLPQLAQTIGGALKEFRKASSDIRQSIEDEVEEVSEAVSLKGDELEDIEKTINPPNESSGDTGMTDDPNE